MQLIQRIQKIVGIDIVVWRLTNFTSLDDASKWFGENLWDAYGPIPIETYIKKKDRVFAGVFCAKFASPTDRIKALSVVKTKLLELGGKEIWANLELPSEIRAPEVFLLGLKRQLVEWGFARASVRVEVDGPSKDLKVEGKVVLTVSCVDGVLVCEWGETWKF